MYCNDSVDRLANLLIQESKCPVSTRSSFTKDSHAEKTRLFIIRAIWSLPARSVVAKSTSFIGVRNFTNLLHHYIKELDIENGFNSSNSHVRDILWFCGIAAVRLAIKVEENPSVAYDFLGKNQEALFSILPGLSSIYTVANVIEFENKALQILDGRLGCPIAPQFIDAFLPYIGMDEEHRNEVYSISTFLLALLSFSRVQSAKESTMAIAAIIHALYIICGEKDFQSHEDLLYFIEEPHELKKVPIIRESIVCLLNDRPIESNVLSRHTHNNEPLFIWSKAAKTLL